MSTCTTLRLPPQGDATRGKSGTRGLANPALEALVDTRDGFVDAVFENEGALRAPTQTVDRADSISLFEEVFLLKRIPAWSASTTERAVKMHKLLFVDTGLCAYLQGRTTKRLMKDDAAVGPLLENFVLGELARQAGWANERVTLHHFRTRDGIEVDGVLEAADGRIVGIEVKAAQTVMASDFSGLKHLQSRVPKRFHLGLVLYTGAKVLPFGHQLRAAPISSIWQPAR